jgi:outer membrane protein OmpU
MNKLKKIGLTALAGSLVAASAQAGELSVIGTANMTYATKTTAFGKGIGSDKSITFSGSGELDNGWSVALTTYTTDAVGLSSHSTALTMGSLGTVTIGEIFGSVAASYDEEVPQAYEQISDAGPNNAANYMGSWMDNGGIMYTAPAIDLGVGSLAIKVGFSPDAHDSATSSGGEGTHTGTWGNGRDIGMTLTTDQGLTLGVYAGEREAIKTTNGIENTPLDQFDGTIFAKYSAGPVSIGYQTTYVDVGGSSAAAIAATTVKTIGTSTGIFEDVQYSISFNVNDNLSISYTDGESTYDDQSNVAGGTEIIDVEQSQDAIQVAYSMGGMTISAYQMETTNPGYDSNAAAVSSTEINLGLAF